MLKGLHILIDFAIGPHRPIPQGWERDRCRGAGCPRAAQFGLLCHECHERLLAIVNNRLAAYEMGPSTRVAVTYEGYVKVKIGKTFLPEHRVVMRHCLGRELYPGETVHHINGNRSDNRIENLELWATSQPVGQRPSDLVAYATQILQRYAPELLANAVAE